MSFRQFTSPNKVKQIFTDLIISKESFIPNQYNTIECPEHLLKDIKFALKAYKSNESFADKFLIAPIINSIWSMHKNLNVWSQPYIKIDDMLQGRPDYLVSPLDRQQYEVLSIPIVVIVEAKQENFTHGWGQCLAEMLACQKVNKNSDIVIYGIVSTGLFWEFGKLTGNDFVRDENPISVSDLQKTMDLVNYIFDQAEKEIPNIDKSVIIETLDNEMTDEIENE
jgi:hypothetical protein